MRLVAEIFAFSLAFVVGAGTIVYCPPAQKVLKLKVCPCGDDCKCGPSCDCPKLSSKQNQGCPCGDNCQCVNCNCPKLNSYYVNVKFKCISRQEDAKRYGYPTVMLERVDGYVGEAKISGDTLAGPMKVGNTYFIKVEEE